MSKTSSLINSFIATRESSPDSNPAKRSKKEKLNFEILQMNQKIKSSSATNFICEILQDIIEENIPKVNKQAKNSFYMKHPPNLSFKNFSKRITKYLNPEYSTLIICLIYIDRLLNKNKENIFLTENNVYKLFFTSMVIATKYNEDYFNDNSFYAKVGGVSLSEMNLLEREFLILLEYECYINKDLYKNYEENFEIDEN